MPMRIWQPFFLRPWRPAREEEMERPFEMPSPIWPFGLMGRRLPAEEMTWAPSVEIYENNDSFIIRAELPGVDRDEIDISMAGNTLTIKGKRRPAADVKEEQYLYCEACYGSFSRSITMPAAVDADKIEATYENGVLEIRVPKAKEAMPTKIEVKAR